MHSPGCFASSMNCPPINARSSSTGSWTSGAFATRRRGSAGAKARSSSCSFARSRRCASGCRSPRRDAMAEYSRSQIETMLGDLPRPDFRARLRRNLERVGAMTTTMTTDRVTATHQVATPALRIKNAAAALQFYKDVFGATEVMRFEVEGHIAHAEIEIGN